MECMLVSSLTKVFEDERPEPWQAPCLTLLANQRGAFQLAYEGSGDFKLTVRGIPAFTAYQVVSMPSAYPAHKETDKLYLRTAPGSYPDLLKPIDLSSPLRGDPHRWQALWISLENLPAGEYTLELQAGNELLQLPVTVLSLRLPDQTLYHTEWFHGDCLADYYGTEVFSPRHWQALEGFLRGAARCGVNMILTPVFTPPLDTQVGGERTTIQLVDVVLKDGIYTFGFQKLSRWISLCRKYGITELEISHLFTQWGAEAAPKVMVTEDGVLKRKFGWDTPAAGGEYTRFLRQFLPALREFLTSVGMWEHSWFHISDEPWEDQKQAYEQAKNSVLDLLPEERCIDALSSFDFYQHGIVKKPVVCEDHIEPFVSAGVRGLWTYYCTAQGLQVPNRFFSMPSGRNRILGILLYVYDLKGFLHWGLNFYNSQFSLTHIDPFQVTDAGGAFPSGDPFLLYPTPDLSAWPSIRSEVLFDGLQDLRLLQLAEEKLGREAVLSLITEAAGYKMTFTHYPAEEFFFSSLQKAILKAIR